MEGSDVNRPTAVDDATTTPLLSNISSQTILPIIIPSLDESSSNILQTNQIETSVAENQQSQEVIGSQTSANNNEFTNPRGIRFTTASPTNESSKGKTIEKHSYRSFFS